ncbi:MAG: xanthine dehydrogenase family protein molybdopterin-binding subunit [Actinomycetota bacterium]
MTPPEGAITAHHVDPVTLPRFDRADGLDKVTGSGRYTADLTLSGMLHAAFVYSEHSHARIRSLDTTLAEQMPGVMAVITAADVPDVRYTDGAADRRLFAKDTVRYDGDVIAAVAATTLDQARAAAAAVEVEYEVQPAVTDLEAALEPDSPLVHPEWAEYAAMDGVVRERNIASFSSIAKGDATAAMDDADVVISGRYVADASHATPIEPRAVVAQWEGDKVTIWSSTQVPFRARTGVCETLQLPTNKVRIIVPHLGGGFGGKCGFHYEAHVAALAQAAGRPVKLVFTRREEFLAPDRRREGMIVELTTGLRADGTILARAGRVLLDGGAYMADGEFFPQMAAMHVAGPYKMDHCSIESTLVYTNRQPSGSVRAPTAPQGCWAVETHTDELAAASGMDPVAFRKLNAVDEGDEGCVGQVYNRIGLQTCIDEAVAAVGAPDELPHDEAIGVAIGWWPSFPGASGAVVRLDEDGQGQIVTGAQENGTGSVMTLRQLAADELGLTPQDFQIVYQDTAAAPWDAGSSGSQTLINNGRAVVAAAGRVADQLKDLAAAELEASPDDIVLADGSAHVAGTPARSVRIAELAAIAGGGALLVASGSEDPPEYPEVEANCIGDMGVAGWAGPQFSCHAAHVRVDPDTGVARVLKVGAAHDSGTIINPLPALGQIEGGIMMGIGQALTEVTHYDERGNQRNPGLLEYKLQTSADVPDVQVVFVEPGADGVGPRGAKGLAEAPNVTTAAAINNAITAVIGTPVRQLPMSAERVWATANGIDMRDGK